MCFVFLYSDVHTLNLSFQEHERGVKFNVEEEDGYPPGAGEKQRLHRRDTPHHLKNKRINQQVDKEKVATIIAQALKKKEEESGDDGDSADGSRLRNENNVPTSASGESAGGT